MALATPFTTYIGMVVFPDEASSAYVSVVMIFASKNPCMSWQLSMRRL